jgi:hypothetical protein
MARSNNRTNRVPRPNSRLEIRPWGRKKKERIWSRPAGVIAVAVGEKAPDPADDAGQVNSYPYFRLSPEKD